jgi:hypothetical protein
LGLKCHTLSKSCKKSHVFALYESGLQPYDNLQLTINFHIQNHHRVEESREGDITPSVANINIPYCHTLGTTSNHITPALTITLYATNYHTYIAA